MSVRQKSLIAESSWETYNCIKLKSYDNTIRRKTSKA